jgi:hypothetical protein
MLMKTTKEERAEWRKYAADEPMYYPDGCTEVNFASFVLRLLDDADKAEELEKHIAEYGELRRYITRLDDGAYDHGNVWKLAELLPERLP